MAYKAKKPVMNNNQVQFPPEADGDFDVVSVSEIAAWKQRLNDRFGIGRGELVPVEEPVA